MQHVNCLSTNRFLIWPILGGISWQGKQWVEHVPTPRQNCTEDCVRSFLWGVKCCCNHNAIFAVGKLMMSRNVTCSLSLQPTGAALIWTPQKQIEPIKKVIRHEVLITERLSVSESTEALLWFPSEQRHYEISRRNPKLRSSMRFFFANALEIQIRKIGKCQFLWLIANAPWKGCGFWLI